MSTRVAFSHLQLAAIDAGEVFARNWEHARHKPPFPRVIRDEAIVWLKYTVVAVETENLGTADKDMLYQLFSKAGEVEYAKKLLRTAVATDAMQATE